MADITKCQNSKCIMREKCYRFKTDDSEYQSYAEFSKICNQDNDFEMYMKIGKE